MKRLPARQTRRTLPSPLQLLIMVSALVLLWVALGGNDFAALILGVPTVLLALASAVWLSPSFGQHGDRPVTRSRRNLLAFVRFVPAFLYLSLAAGIDVARRAIAPTRQLNPALIDYSLRLPPGAARHFFMLVVSLLPGTLSADIEGDRLTVHVLDKEQDNAAALDRLENRIAHIYGLLLEDSGADAP